jgi:quercetin dioxygenase-like cupin family protein
MDLWRLGELSVRAHEPQVLQSDPEGRAVVLELPAGERLQEHEVHERAWLLVVWGTVEVLSASGDTHTAPAGSLAVFDPHERHEVCALEDARLLLLLGPWPGAGR